MFNLDSSLLEWIHQNRWKPIDQFWIMITDTTSYVAISIALTVFLVGILRKWNDVKWKGVQLVVALICNAIIVTSLKHIIGRERPFINNPLIEKLSSGGSPSFPSGHTADAFVMAMSITLLGTRRWIVVAVWIWACMVAYTRMALGVHYPSDILGSVLVGSLIAYFVHLNFKKRREKMQPDANLEEI